MRKFTEGNIQQCIKAGCNGVFVNKDGWLCGELPNGKGEILFRYRMEILDAWVVRSGSPIAITRETENGFTPQRGFRSIGEACRLAIQNPSY